MTKYEIWTLALRIAAVLTSAIIAILAIWGDWIRYTLTPPRLVVKLRSERGQLTVINGKKFRYYHLEVSNSCAWVFAKNVQVYVNQIDRINPANEWIKTYETGPIPLAWQYAAHCPETINIGKERYCDLGHICESQEFVISTRFVPAGFDGTLKQQQRMRVHLVAVADNAKSSPMKLELAWDGKWDDGTDEMARHLSVKDMSKR